MTSVSGFLRKEIVLDRSICNIFGVLVFCALTVFGAFIRIPLPFTPVPITAQTFFVLFSGLCLGARLGLYSQLLYIGLGIVGLPVFSGGTSGILHLFGPTGGYIFGFCLGTFVTGFFVEFNKESFLWVLLSVMLGCLTLYLTGIIHLSSFLGISIKRAVYLGALPFLTVEILKILLAAVSYIKLKAKISNIFCV